MNKEQQAEQEVYQHVDWCFKRAEKVSEADAEALYSEFNEWIEFIEDESVTHIDITKIENNPK